jgi:flagellar biosynthetic protein FliP
MPRFLTAFLTLLIILLPGVEASAQSGGGISPINVSVGVNPGGAPEDLDMGIRVLFLITLLTLAPSIILLMTSFLRIVIVLSFVRQALSLQGTPANQVIIGLSLFLTFFLMAPIWGEIDQQALEPYRNKQINSEQAFSNATVPLKNFMMSQARPKDLELFISLAGMGPTTVSELPMKIVIPGFILSELKTAFQMGFLLFVPFIVIDLVVATVLMSMGMMMMPPVTVSLPLKILLFVLVDGWHLVVSSVVMSFRSG